MKKIVLMLLMLAGLAFTAHAAATNTPTWTPNATQTQAIVNIQATQTAIAATATYIKTAFPTLTPTLTPTGTISPSPTFTPAPKQLKNTSRLRLYFQPQQFTQADGVSPMLTYSAAGATTAWLVQSLSQTAFVLSTGAAEVRLGMTVPWNFKGELKLYLLMGAQTTTDSVTITANVVGQHFNDTTQTVGTYSYTPPPGGLFYLNGTAANVIAGVQALNPLWAATQVISRVQMPLNPSAISYATANPPGYIQAGDVLNFDIKRSTGGSGNVYVYSAEVQYDNATDANP